jgi:transcriptional regulator of acetoin/glycerol metabolism
MAELTSSMDGMNRARRSRTPLANAGLVLLYAPNHAALPPVFRLTGEPVVIGREPPPDGFVIDQRAASRLHASVGMENGAWVIRDMGSRNGVIVNGRFAGEHVLAPDDQVRIGDAVFKFVPDDADGYARFRIDDPGVSFADGVGGQVMSVLASHLQTIAKTDLPVLLLGETGSGKELAVRVVHEASGRKGPMCALNCAAIPSNLIESELFGWKRGAFSGADRDHSGIVRSADGGTLFLDEVAEMPVEAQAKLLRMIETRQVLPLGSAREATVDVRIVCATHRDLRKLVADGEFRGDLFARIHGYTVELPPLRRRKEDIFRLVRHFLAKSGRPDLDVTLAFMVAACHYDWPFNVRELEVAIRRAAALAEAPELDARHLPEIVVACMEGYAKRQESKANQQSMLPPRPPLTTAPTADELRALLERHSGNVSAVARELGKERTQIHRWMRMHGMKRG